MIAATLATACSAESATAQRATHTSVLQVPVTEPEPGATDPCSRENTAEVSPQDPLASLSVEATVDAGDCPDTQATKVATEHRAGRILFVTSIRKDPHFHVKFSRRGDSYEAEVQAFGGREGHRFMNSKAPTCAELAQAVPLVLVVMLEAHGVSMPAWPCVEPKPSRKPTSP